MPLNREVHVLGCDSIPIVDHLDPHQAATVERDVDVRGAGVDGVLEQLLHHRCRALDNLPRGDRIRHHLREAMDAGGDDHVAARSRSSASLLSAAIGES